MDQLSTASFVSRALLAATFTDVRTPAVKSLGVVELWFCYQAHRPATVRLAVPALRTGWDVPRDLLAAGLFRPVEQDRVSVASGPNRTRLLLPAGGGRLGVVALYTPRDPLLDAITDTAAVVPFTSTTATSAHEAGWSA